MPEVSIRAEWKEWLQHTFDQPYFSQLIDYLKDEKKKGAIIYPKGKDIFSAFELTPPQKIKVVILGQDPYYGPGQAHGLSFSVPRGVAIPPSLQNIFKELQHDLQIPIPTSGNLTHWAQEGVLLLNAALTVRAGMPMSHSTIGWHHFTDFVISTIAQKCEAVVFILWGKFAQSKAHLIDPEKHLILKTAHPSPLSAFAGFLGSRPFSKANDWLTTKGIGPVNWRLA